MKCFGIAAFLSTALLLAQQPEATTVVQPTPAAVAMIHRRAMNPQNVYVHIVTVVPFTGKGTYNDPKRPMYLPASRASAVSHTDIIGFTYVASDDGKSAIVEYVAANKAALQPIYADPSLKIFQKGVHSQAEIETEMKKYRKGFSLKGFGVTAR